MDHLVVELLNTTAGGTDTLESPLGVARWWARAGADLPLPPAQKPRFDATLATALQSLRTALLRVLDGHAAGMPLVFRGDGSDAILFEVTHAIRTAHASGALHRIRRCRQQACGRYFLDETKNGSRRWCSLRCMERARAPRRRTISR
jgi:predicted RNA-binding Zn ribbon-like protein